MPSPFGHSGPNRRGGVGGNSGLVRLLGELQDSRPVSAGPSPTGRGWRIAPGEGRAVTPLLINYTLNHAPECFGRVT
jgi:hypothetical protein